MATANFEFDYNGYKATKTNIARPTEIACYSVDEQGEFHPFSEASLRYYYPPFFTLPHVPHKPINLSAGFESFQKKDDSQDKHLDLLLATLEQLERREAKIQRPDFITWRGIITKLLMCIFEQRDAFELRATRFQGTIFIEIDHEASRIRSAKERAKRSSSWRNATAFSPDMMEYWGYKFEALSLLKAPVQDVSREDIENRPNMVVSNIAEYCSVTKTGLGKNSIIIGGEVDGVLGYKPKPEEPHRWVELKTCRTPDMSHWKANQNHTRKLLKWWAQSFMIGCPQIITGYRDDQGWLQELKVLKTQQIPNMIKNAVGDKWDANLAIHAATHILDFMKQQITEGGVWRIVHHENQPGYTLFQESTEGTGNIVSEAFKQWRESEEAPK